MLYSRETSPFDSKDYKYIQWFWINRFIKKNNDEEDNISDDKENETLV